MPSLLVFRISSGGQMRVCLCQMDRRYQMRRYHIRVCSAFERRTHARKGAEERGRCNHHPLAAMDARFGSWDDALDLRSPKQASRWVADCEACCFKSRLLQKLEALTAELKVASGCSTATACHPASWAPNPEDPSSNSAAESMVTCSVTD